MIDTAALIRGANLCMNIYSKRLVEDIAWYNALIHAGCNELQTALHLRMAVLFSLLELTTIEKAILSTKHAFAKRYHYKNLVANTSECYKLLYHFNKARKKSIWTRVGDLAQKSNSSDLSTQYQDITNQLNDYGDNKINKESRDITMHYSESMLTVYQLTIAITNENDAHQYYCEFTDILRQMLDFANKLVDLFANQDSMNNHIALSTNLIGDAKLQSVIDQIDAHRIVVRKIDEVMPKGTDELDYFAQEEKRLEKIHDLAKQNLPIQDDDLISEMLVVVKMADMHVLMHFMMLDMMSNLEALYSATSTVEAALHIRRFVIPQVSMLIWLFGYFQEEQEHSLWHYTESKVPQSLASQQAILLSIMQKLFTRVCREDRNKYVHVYDDKGTNLIPVFVESLESMNFEKELKNVLLLTRFYSLFNQFLTMLMSELARIAHENNEQSSKMLHTQIAEAMQKVEKMPIPAEMKQQLLERINRIKEIAK